jgi:hypothetical protein
MGAASCWESASTALPPEVSATLNASGDAAITDLALLVAIPEWEVELPGGPTTSCTDVLAVASNANGLAVIAVEAKVDEPFGPTLGKKRSGASTGQLERLDFLHQQLGLATKLPDDVRYQLLHRTVSAILTARAFHAPTAVMIVQSFSPTSLWWADFEKFCRALGVTPAAGVAAHVPTLDKPHLFVGWCRGDQRFRLSALRSRA